MIPVMKKFKIFGLSPELPVTSKKLSAEEPSVIGIIETFYHAIPPWFSNRNKNNLDSHQQAKSQDNTQRSGVSVTAMKA
jgi:hypothetical protein